MKIFGRSLREYLAPIKLYVFCSVLIVLSQYAVGLPLAGEYPFFLNLTQAAWALMVALSTVKLIFKYDDFGMKNVLALGVMYSVMIHGLKVSIRYVFYGKDLPYIVGRFAYGSFLVMAVAVGVGLIVLHAKKKRLLDEKDSAFLRQL